MEDIEARLQKVISLLSEEMDAVPLPGGESYAIQIAKQIDTLRRAIDILKLYIHD